MTHQIRYGTYNIGVGWGDYSSMAYADKDQRAKIDAALSHCQNEEENLETRNQLQTKIEKTVADRLTQQFDVICLQEVKKIDRTLIKELKDQGFAIYYVDQDKARAENEQDCDNAIALRSSLFEDDVQNISQNSESHPTRRGDIGQDIAAVVAKVKGSSVKLAFSSLHEWGFKLYHPAEEKKGLLS